MAEVLIKNKVPYTTSITKKILSNNRPKVLDLFAVAERKDG